METICLKCLQKDPARRYATAETLAEDLERWLRHEPIRARPSGVWERALKWAKRHPARAGLVAAALLAPAVIITVLLVMGNKLTDERNLALGQKNIATNEAARAATAQRSAETNALSARQNSYAADIYLAAQFVEDGRFGPALDLLKNHEPAPGQADVRGFEWRWLRSQCGGDPARVLRGHSNAVHTLAFSADGRRMASGGRARIHLWATENWQETGSFPDPNDPAVWDAKAMRWLDLVQRDPKKGLELVTGRTGLETEIAPSRPDRADATVALAFSPDGRILMSAGHNAYVKFWDVPAGRLRTWYESENAQAAFLADGRVVALVEFRPVPWVIRRSLMLVDPATGKPVQTLATNVAAFAASANGRWFATVSNRLDVSNRQEVAVWDASNLVVVGRFQVGDPLVGMPAVSSDGRRVANAVWDGDQVRIYHADKGWRQVGISGLKAQVHSLAFSPDGQRLALGMRDSTVRLHDTANGKLLRRFTGHLGEVFAVAWEPGGRVVSAAQDGTIRLWDPVELPRTSGIRPRFERSVVSPDSDQFAGIQLDHRIVIWDGRAPEPRVLNDRKDFVPLAFRPEESALLVGTDRLNPGPTLELWRLVDGAALRTLTMAFGGNRLASPRGDRVVVWRKTEAVVHDVANGRELARFHDKRMRFRDYRERFEQNAGVFTGGRFIVLTQPFGASVWDVATGRCLSIIRTPDGVETVCLAATPDGALVFTGDDDHRIRVWDARDGLLLRTLSGHGGAIQLLTVTPDGRTLASHGADRTVKLWSLPTGRELMTLARDREYIRLFFTPDGQALAAANSWTGAEVWHVEAMADLNPHSPPVTKATRPMQVTRESTNSAPAATSPNVVLWLLFDDLDGGFARNNARGYDGVLFNGPSRNPGNDVVGSLCFDGHNDYVQVTPYPAMQFGTNDFSVGAWVKPAQNNSSIRTIVDHREENGPVVRGYSFLLWRNNQLHFQLADGTFSQYPSQLPVPADGRWHHVAVTVKRGDAQGICLYVDGVPDPGRHNPTAHSGSVTAGPGYPFRVGSRSSMVSVEQMFKGCISEVQVFNRVLTPAEIDSLYNAGTASRRKPNP